MKPQPSAKMLPAQALLWDPDQILAVVHHLVLEQYTQEYRIWHSAFVIPNSLSIFRQEELVGTSQLKER
jgi:hypothetical protein